MQLFSKKSYISAQARILRHPIVQNKMVKLKLCTSNGIKEVIITKKHGELYKEAKKKKIGDSLNNFENLFN